MKRILNKKSFLILVIAALVITSLTSCTSSDQDVVSNPTNFSGSPSKGEHPDGPNIGMQKEEPDLAEAAAQLGITEEALIAALGDPTQGAPDFAAAAQLLGISEEELLAALGIQEGGMPQRGEAPPKR
jgi:di/tricarboxylate transporter